MAIRALGGQVSFPLSDRVLRDDYLAGLDDRSLAEIRAMRAECEEAEVAVSFARRVLQGHLDIVASEVRRRNNGELPHHSALHDLVERLPQILADDGHRGGPSWRPIDVDPEMPAGELLVAIDIAVGGGTLAELPRLSQEEVEEVAERLGELERSFSQTRRQLHQRIDLLKNELSLRYERGEVTVEGLLA